MQLVLGNTLAALLPPASLTSPTNLENSNHSYYTPTLVIAMMLEACSCNILQAALSTILITLGCAIPPPSQLVSLRSYDLVRREELLLSEAKAPVNPQTLAAVV